MHPELIPKAKSDLSDVNFKKWKLLPRRFEGGKDGRSVNKNLYNKSIISYLYKETVQYTFKRTSLYLHITSKLI